MLNYQRVLGRSAVGKMVQNAEKWDYLRSLYFGRTAAMSTMETVSVKVVCKLLFKLFSSPYAGFKEGTPSLGPAVLGCPRQRSCDFDTLVYHKIITHVCSLRFAITFICTAFFGVLNFAYRKSKNYNMSYLCNNPHPGWILSGLVSKSTTMVTMVILKHPFHWFHSSSISSRASWPHKLHWRAPQWYLLPPGSWGQPWQKPSKNRPSRNPAPDVAGFGMRSRKIRSVAIAAILG